MDTYHCDIDSGQCTSVHCIRQHLRFWAMHTYTYILTAQLEEEEKKSIAELSSAWIYNPILCAKCVIDSEK